MRIALLALHFAEYASRLAIGLSDEHDVLLILRSSNAGSELTEELRRQVGERVVVRYVEPRRRRDPRILGTSLLLNSILDAFSPDVLHIQEVHPAWVGWTLLSSRRRIPVVTTVHDPVQHSGGLSRHAWQWKLVMWFRGKSARLIVHGPRMQAELEDLEPGLAGRVDVIPHGVLGRMEIDRDTTGYEPGAFLFFGRILAYKGLRYLLDAGDILHGRGRVLRLIVAGSGSDLENHRQRIASSPWVELIDRYIGAAEIPGLFRRAMAVVLPYTDATQSGVSAMAFGCSRPVIATDVGDVPDVVIDGKTGLVVPPRDGKALADAMEKLLDEPSPRDALAAGAGRFAAEKLCWKNIAQATARCYLRAIKAHPATSMRRKDLVPSTATGTNAVTLGVLLDGRIQEGWVLDSVRQALAVAGTRLGAVAVVDGIARGPFASRLHGAVDAIDKYMRCRNEPLFTPIDVAAACKLALREVRGVSHADGWSLDDAGIATLQQCKVDVWLCFTANAPRRPLGAVSRLGVWGIEIGKDVPASAPWAGAPELTVGCPVTMVGVVDYAAHGDGVLYRAFGATVRNSARRNRLGSLYKATSFFRRLLEHRARDGAACHCPLCASPIPAPPRYPALREPTVPAIGRLSWKLVTNVAGNRLRSLRWRDQWQMAYHFAEPNEAGFRTDRLSYLVPPKDRFWADPFAVEHDGRHFIFFEEMSFRTHKGRIMAMEVFENREPGEPQVALERPYHVSYPFVFSWQGSLYMMPETAANGTLEVYRCESFPLRWQLHKVVLDNISAYDSTLWRDGDRWWLFANVAEPGADSSDELHLFSGSSPLGPWTAHPSNPIVSDVRRARPAGPLFAQDGVLYRPSQDCSLAYGHTVLINRVDKLCHDEYRETVVDRVAPGWRKDILHVHTLGGSPRLRVVDYMVSRKMRF